MKLNVSMQNRLWETLEVPGPGYDVIGILDSIQSARAAGQIAWVDWDQPLRLDIQIVEQ
jgi:hypothetical protein